MSAFKKVQREQVAFLITLVLAIAFVAIGALKGSDITYGVQTSLTVVTTVTATVKAVISISATGTVALGNLIPDSGAPANNTGYVAVTSNSEQGWKLYNYADNYMTKTDGGISQSISNVPCGPPTAPEPWVTGTDFGLGFSLSGPINDAVWHYPGGYNYASFTTTSAGAQLVNNYVTWSNRAESLTVLYVLDADDAQLTGEYAAEVSWFAVTHV